MSTPSENISKPNKQKKFIRLMFLIISLSILLINCQGFPQLFGIDPSPNIQIISSVENATSTPTPFQPMPLTPTSNPFKTPTPAPTSTTEYYEVYSPLSVPPRANLIAEPENQINILLMGSDQRPNDSGFRTDVLLLVTINFDDNSVNLTSFPRDLFVYIPGWKMDRINTAQLRGGFALTAQTFEYNFGIILDHYAIINFSGFEYLINTLGGINVNVGHQITDARDGYDTFTVNPGINHMDGETALWYVRSRHSSSDLDRIIRQQEVLQAIFDKLLSLDILAKVPELYNQFKGVIQTDFVLEDLIELSQFAINSLNKWTFNRYLVDYQHVSNWTNPYTGAQVLLPTNDFINDIILKALNAD